MVTKEQRETEEWIRDLSGDSFDREWAEEKLLTNATPASIAMMGQAYQASSDDFRRGLLLEIMGKTRLSEALPYLVEGLDDVSSYPRERAAEGLGALGSLDAVPALVRCLEDTGKEHVARARAAATALGVLRAESAVEALGVATRSEDPWVRSHAVDALGEIATPEAHDALVAFVEKRQFRRCTCHSMDKAIRVLCEADVRRAAEAIRDVLGDDAMSLDDRAAAAKCLGQWRDEASVPLLLALVSRDKIAETIFEALGAVGLASSVPTLMSLAQEPIGEDDDGKTRLYALGALGAMQVEESAPLILKALEDAEDWQRGQLLRALGSAGGTDVVEHLLEVLAQNEWNVSSHAAWGLLQVAERRGLPSHALPILAEACIGSQTETRLYALEAINTFEGEEKVPIIRRFLNCPGYEDVQKRAAELLDALGDQTPFELLDALRDPHLGFRRQAFGLFQDHFKGERYRPRIYEVINGLSEEEIVDIFAQGMADPEGNVRVEVFETLRYFDYPGVVDMLCKGLLDESLFVRWAAAVSLQGIGNPKSLDALREAFDKEEDAHAKEAMQDAILALSEVGDVDDAQRIPMLISALDGEYTTGMGEAINAFRTLRAAEAVEPLSRILRDQDAAYRCDAALALGHQGEEALELLVETLSSYDEMLIQHVIHGIVATGTDELATILVPLLSHASDDVALEAANVLAWAGDARCIQGLSAQMYAYDTSLREAILDAIGDIGSRISIDELRETHDDDLLEEVELVPTLLIELWEDEDEVPEIKSHALKALGWLSWRTDASIKAVEDALQSEFDNIRAAAAEALGRMGIDAVAPALLVRLQSEEEEAEVRQQAATALGKLTPALDSAVLFAQLVSRVEGTITSGYEFPMIRDVCEALFALGEAHAEGTSWEKPPASVDEAAHAALWRERAAQHTLLLARLEDEIDAVLKEEVESGSIWGKTPAALVSATTGALSDAKDVWQTLWEEISGEEVEQLQQDLEDALF